MIELTKAKHGFLCQNCFERDDVKEINFHTNGTGIIVRLCAKCRGELIRVLLDDNKKKDEHESENGCMYKGRRLTDAESIGMLFDDVQDIPDGIVPKFDMNKNDVRCEGR